MKHIIYGISFGIITLLSIAIILALGGRTARQNEIDSNLPYVVESTLENLLVDQKYEIDNYQEFLADFTQNLLVQLDTESTIDIDVMGIDIVKGLLSIKVTENYTHPNGKTGKVSCERTVILEQYTLNELSMYQVTYYVEDDVYKQYTLAEGSTLIVPTEPSTEDNNEFMYWMDYETGEKIDISTIVEKDIELKAVFKSDTEI